MLPTPPPMTTASGSTMLMTAAIASPNLDRSLSQRGPGGPVPGARALDDLGQADAPARAPSVVALQGRAGDDRLDAPRATAVARCPLAPHRVVPPLAGDPVEAVQHPAVDDDSPAAARPEDQADDDPPVAAGPEQGLGEGEAVGVVCEPCLDPEGGGEVLADGLRRSGSVVLEFLRTPVEGRRRRASRCRSRPAACPRTRARACRPAGRPA